MITTLEVKNFKSLKELHLNCSRVNLFIGEPNTGKSNILESIGILSYPYTLKLKDWIRFKKLNDLFYKTSVDKPISINTDFGNFRLSYSSNLFTGRLEKNGVKQFQFIYDYFDVRDHKTFIGVEELPKFYRYVELATFSKPELSYLLPPYGENLFSILDTNLEIYDFANELFKRYGYEVLLRPENYEIELLIKDRKHIVIPYILASDTIKRVIFFNTILEMNSNSTIVLEEPESHIYPFYNKFLAERIALYNTNQFFIATHNPTFLANIIEQTPDEELKVFVTYYEDYQTKVFELSGKKLSDTYKIFGAEMFGNLDKIIRNLDSIIEKENLELR